MEKVETVESVIASAGGRQVSDVEWYLATGAGGDRMVALVDMNYNTATGELTVMDWDTGNYAVVKAESGGKPWGAPIPKGEYDILERAGRDNFYRLDRVDANPRNDIDDASGRGAFRLHRPGLTTGCIACKGWDGWSDINGIIQNTSTQMTTDMAKYHWWQGPSGAPITQYGRLTVE